MGMSETNVVRCPRCKATIGTLCQMENVTLLQIGGALCREWHGSCAACGYGLHWSVSQRVLNRLLERWLHEGENEVK